MKLDVLCIGQACIDVLIKESNETEVSNERIKAENIDMNIGGDSANEASCCVALGCDTGLFYLAGDDYAASIISDNVKKLGIRDYRSTVPGYSTPIVCVNVHKDGERNFCIAKDSVYYTNNVVRISDELIKSCKVLSLGSLFLQPLIDPDEILRIVKIAKENNTKVCIDVRVTDQYIFEDYLTAIRLADYVIPNRDEAFFYSGCFVVEEAAKAFFKMGIRNIVIKDGANGCLYMGEKGSFRVPAYSSDPSDTTGAGDNFLGGFLYGLSRNMDPFDCCRYANACASIAITRHGGFNVIKNLDEVESKLKIKR